MDISIGKFTLESLTTGMYNEPESCYREYIQNAVDSIDMAIEQGILTLEQSRIEILIDKERCSISIKDNGKGIGGDLARKTLLDIGNSSKLHTVNRGFRGIGRLGGLSYCKKLSFCTTAYGDETKTVVSFDCEKLKELLVPGQGKEQSLQEVIGAVTTVTVLEEQAASHYFIVKMEQVDELECLLDIHLVKDYISQVAPVPFNRNFYWSEQIKHELSQNGVSVAEYPIFIGKSFEELSQIFKPYKTWARISSRSSDEVKDEVYGISYYEVPDANGEALASGWYADTGFLGTIADENIAGIRVRLGNIMIGHAKTLAPYFKESRFDGWAMGELYIISNGLIPNARRDDFERNSTFSEFENGVAHTLGSVITDKIRTASKLRNNPSQKAIRKAEKSISRTEVILTTGFNSSFEKEQLVTELQDVKKELTAISKNASEDVIQKKIQLIQQIGALEESVTESVNYKSKCTTTSEFSKGEKKIIQAILEVLTRNFARETVDALYAELLQELKVKGKK